MEGEAAWNTTVSEEERAHLGLRGWVHRNIVGIRKITLEEEPRDPSWLPQNHRNASYVF